MRQTINFIDSKDIDLNVFLTDFVSLHTRTKLRFIDHPPNLNDLKISICLQNCPFWGPILVPFGNIIYDFAGKLCFAKKKLDKCRPKVNKPYRG